MSLILGFDTATPTASVALFDGESQQVLARADEPVQTHGKALMTITDRVLKEAGAAKRDLDAVACGLGPGSFTGVRVGLATAKGICFALNIPLLGLSSLQILAGRAVETSVGGGPVAGPAVRAAVMPCLDARRAEVYLAAYWSDMLAVSEVAAGCEPWLGPMALSPAGIGKVLHAAVVGAAARTESSPLLDSPLRFVVLGNGIDVVGDRWTEIEERLDDVVELVVARNIDPWPDAGALVRYAHVLLKAGHPVDLDRAQPIYLRPSDAEERFGLDLSPK